MLQMVIILLPKSDGNYRGIGLQDLVWKIIEVSMEDRLKYLKLHHSPIQAVLLYVSET